MVDAEGTGKALNFEVRKALYDDETCVQLVVKPGVQRGEVQVAAQMQQIRNQDVVTGLFNRHHLVEQLEQVLARTLAEHSNSALVSIEVEDFLGIVQTRLGVAAADIALGIIAAHLKSLCHSGEILCRYSDDCFMLLIPSISADAALGRADAICRNLREHIVTVDDVTLMFGYALGIGLINDTTVSAETPSPTPLKPSNCSTRSGRRIKTCWRASMSRRPSRRAKSVTTMKSKWRRWCKKPSTRAALSCYSSLY